MAARCPHCSEPTLPGAQYCARCGQSTANGHPAAAGEPPHRSIDFGKMSAPLPPAGIAFVAALVLGPAAILVGVVAGVKLLVYAGVVILIGLVLLLVLGEFL